MDIRGKVSGGVVVLEDSNALPDGTVVRVEPVEDKAAALKAPEGEQSLSEMLLSHSGKAKGLPEDMALNHDHYLHGLPKKKE